MKGPRAKQSLYSRLCKWMRENNFTVCKQQKTYHINERQST